jgi:hypothetical protein
MSEQVNGAKLLVGSSLLFFTCLYQPDARFTFAPTCMYAYPDVLGEGRATSLSATEIGKQDTSHGREDALHSFID